MRASCQNVSMASSSPTYVRMMPARRRVMRPLWVLWPLTSLLVIVMVLGFAGAPLPIVRDHFPIRFAWPPVAFVAGPHRADEPR